MKLIFKEYLDIFEKYPKDKYLTREERKERYKLLQEYEKKNYSKNLYTGRLFAEDLCVSESNVELDGYEEDTTVQAAALFAQTDKNVLYSYSAHKKVYPASITKIMTALLTIENCKQC